MAHNEGMKAMARVLVVDDDESLLRLMGEYLESAGIECDLAAGAKQARNLLGRSGYDVVVSEFNMRGESGLDLLRHSSFRYPKIPFILWAGCDPQSEQEAKKMGVCAYLEKPFYMDELLRTIINVGFSEDKK